MEKDNWEKFLVTLKGSHQIHKMNEDREKKARVHLELKRRDAGSYLELLGTNTFTDESDGFKVWLRKYKKVKVVDKKAFMVWLKTNLEPSEVIEFLCPPTTSADLKKFVENQYEKRNDPFLEIDGLEVNTSHILIKTKYPNEEE